MARIPAFTIAIIGFFSGLLFLAYIFGFDIPDAVIQSLKDFIAIAGFVFLVGTSILAYRKKLLSSSFDQFKTDYTILQQSLRIEIDDFKSDVRGYINRNEERHTKTMDKIVQIYEDIRSEIREQNKICDMIQTQKPFIEKEEKEWKNKMERAQNKTESKLKEIDDEIKYIIECVNNKKPIK